MNPEDYQFLSGMMRGKIVSSTVVTPNKEYAYVVEVLDVRYSGSNLTDVRNVNRPWPDSLNIEAAPAGSACIVFFTGNKYIAAVFGERPQTEECDDAPAP